MKPIFALIILFIIGCNSKPVLLPKMNDDTVKNHYGGYLKKDSCQHTLTETGTYRIIYDATFCEGNATKHIKNRFKPDSIHKISKP